MTTSSTHRSFGANALATVIQIASTGIAVALRWQDRSRAMRHLRDLEDFRLKDMGLALHLSEVKGPVMDRLLRSHFIEQLTGQVYLSQYDAMVALTPKEDVSAA